MDGKTAKGVETHIRGFSSTRDASGVAEILREAREAASWAEADLHGLEMLPGMTAYVSVIAGKICGIVVGRRVLDEAEVLNLAVRPAARRQGMGSALMSRLLEELRRNRVSRVFLEVRESNAGALAFYQRLGFQAVGKRKDYYQDPLESATIMERWLKESTDCA